MKKTECTKNSRKNRRLQTSGTFLSTVIGALHTYVDGNVRYVILLRKREPTKNVSV